MRGSKYSCNLTKYGCTPHAASCTQIQSRQAWEYKHWQAAITLWAALSFGLALGLQREARSVKL